VVQAQQRSGPHYKVNATNAVSVRKSWKTDTAIKLLIQARSQIEAGSPLQAGGSGNLF